MNWLRDEDLNTKFFHRSATIRKNFQSIDMLDDNSAEVRTREGMCSIAKTYFENLFAVKNGMYDPVLNLIQPTFCRR